MSIPDASNLDFFNAVLPVFMAKRFGPGGMGMTNNLVGRTNEFMSLFKGKKIQTQAGSRVRLDLIIKEDALTGFTGPYEQRILKEINQTVVGYVPWSVFEVIVPMEEIEQHLSDGGRGDDSIVFQLYESRLEGSMTIGGKQLENTFFHATGSAELLTQKRPPFPGMKYWITRDGYHVTGLGSVADVNAQTYTPWLNNYAGPLGNNLNDTRAHASAAKDKITSANELLRWTKKMVRYCQFASPNTGRTPAADKDFKGRTQVDQQRLYVDEIAYEAWEQIQDSIGHGNDKVAPEETVKPAPNFRGIPLQWIPQLGVGAGGLPTAVHSDVGTLTDRGALAAGSYANTGEMYFVNLDHFRPIAKEGVAPLIKPAEKVPEQQAAMQVNRWLLTTACNMRMIQGVIWGFSALKAA